MSSMVLHAKRAQYSAVTIHSIFSNWKSYIYIYIKDQKTKYNHQMVMPNLSQRFQRI
jgi:hypothetical protein